MSYDYPKDTETTKYVDITYEVFSIGKLQEMVEEFFPDHQDNSVKMSVVNKQVRGCSCGNNLSDYQLYLVLSVED